MGLDRGRRVNGKGLRRRGIAVLCVLSPCLLSPSIADAVPGPSRAHVVRPAQLTVNYLADPLGIDSTPHFSWNSETARQTGYELRVRALSAAGVPGRTVWDTGRVRSVRDLDVPYAGARLRSATRYSWQVRVWDSFGRTSAWSRAAWFETGLLEPSDWSAQWIGGRQKQDHNWSDMTEQVEFTIPSSGAASGAGFLFHAQPIGKTWGEGYLWQLSLPAAASTAVFGAVPAGATTVGIADSTGLVPGRTITIGHGAGAESVTIASVEAASTSSTLAAAAAAGDTTITVAHGFGFSDGATIVIGSGGSAETATVKTVGPFSYGPMQLTLTAPLTKSHSSGDPVVGTGRVSLLAPTRSAHPNGAPVTAPSTPLLAELVQHYDQPDNRRSETNGTFPPQVVVKAIGAVSPDRLARAGITSSTVAGTKHRLVIGYHNGTITTAIDGTHINSVTPAPGVRMPDGFNDIERSGTVGFSAGSQVTVSRVSVHGDGSPDFSTTFAHGANPFQSGDVTAAGLVSPGVIPADSPAHDVMLPIANPAPLLRKQFSALHGHGIIVAARLYVAGGGWPAVTLNGSPVTDAHLYPDRSQYDKTVLYDTFDVTRLVRSSSNVLGAQLGRGYYAYTTPDEWLWQLAPYDRHVPSMLGQLEIHYADGTTQTIGTDGSWKTADGPTTFDDVYTGEKYDARALPVGWDVPGFNARSWAPARRVNPPTGYSTRTGRPVPARLVAQENPPVRVMDVLRPVSVSKAPLPDTYVLDFGQIVTGWPRLQVRGRAGETVSLDAAETLNPDGTVLQGAGSTFIDGRYATSYYTLSGRGVETWQPSFSYTGFRYIQVTGLPKVPTLRDPEVTAVVARSDNPVTGDVHTSNALLNRILRNAKWAEWNNTVETETDTPDREKNGWTGDAQIDSLAEMLQNNDAAFDSAYLEKLVDTQTGAGPFGGTHGGGQYSFIAPNSRGEYGTDQTPGWNASYGPTPEWDAAAFVYPWEMYQQYGDTQILSRLYASQKYMMAWYSHYFTAANDYQYNTFLGVYSAAGSNGVAGNIIDNLEYYWYMANYMSNAAQLLGKANDSVRFRRLANAVEKSLITHYWSDTTGAASGGSFVDGNIESENALALGMGIVQDAIGRGLLPRTAVQTVTDAIAYDVENVADTHIYSGVEGIAPMFAALSEHGYIDLAYRLATQTTYPSYGNEIALGATSMWENWGGGSHDHHYQAAISVWYYQQLAGIQPNLDGSTRRVSDSGYVGLQPKSVGYRSIQILPYIPESVGTTSVPPTRDPTTGRLNHVRGTMKTVRGEVVSDWTRRSDGRIDLKVTIPANTTATVWVPTQGEHVSAPAGATYVGTRTVGADTSLGGRSARYAVYVVGSGSWEWNR